MILKTKTFTKEKKLETGKRKKLTKRLKNEASAELIKQRLIMAKKKNLALGKGAAALFGTLQTDSFEEKKEIIPKKIIEKKNLEPQLSTVSG